MLRTLVPGAGPRTITSQMLPMLEDVAKNRFALIEALAKLQNNDKTETENHNKNTESLIKPIKTKRLEWVVKSNIRLQRS